MKKRQYDELCEGTNCPIKERCERFVEGFDKTLHDHYGIVPFQHNRWKPFEKTGENCYYYLRYDKEKMINDINSIE